MFANLSLNARMWVSALITAIVASGIGLVIAVSSPSGTGGDARAIASPTPLAEETFAPEPTESVPEESPTPEPSVTPSATDTPSATQAPPTAAANRDPRTIDCAREPRYCSDVTGTMTIKDGKLVSSSNIPSRTDYEGVPETKMTTTILKPNQQPASNGDEVGWIKVRVDIDNDTNRTFVFPQRKVALVVRHNNEEDVNSTSGPYTEVPPGGALHADFLNPEIEDGTYQWRAKVFFYAK